MKHRRNDASCHGRGRLIALCPPLLLSAALLRCAQGDNDQPPITGTADDGAVAAVDAKASAEDARPARDKDVAAATSDAEPHPEAASGDGAGQPPPDDAPSAPDSGESPDVEPQPEDSGAEDTGVDSTSTSEDSGIDAASPPDSGQEIDTGSPIDASDAATAPDVYDASTPVDASDAAAHDTGVDSATGNCTGIPAWVEGTTAQVVTNDGHKYTCITPGWCSLIGTSAVLAYEPGTGSAWQEAWTDDGACN